MIENNNLETSQTLEQSSINLAKFLKGDICIKNMIENEILYQNH